MSKGTRILLVEDDDAIATVIVSALESENYDVDRCAAIAERDRLLESCGYAAMITDVMLEDGDGIAALGTARQLAPAMPIIIVSAQNTLDTAIRASEVDAFEYFPKPFDLDALIGAVRQAAGSGTGAMAPEQASDGLPLIGRSQAMQDVFRMIAKVLRNDLTVLVTGESGTGKELVAEAIHQLGHRKSGPFVAVNAAAIPHDLIESELFGHEKGAFTGATGQAIGKFEQANGGTLFLDEIGDMPVDAQTRLLRALQSGRIRRVGGRQDVAVDVRIVSATNRDLAPMIQAGRFREDLFYRLAVVPIELPPLRDRREDIGMLARHFLAQAVDEGLPKKGLTPDAADRLSGMKWRGNVRELRNFMFRLAIMARDDTISAELVEETAARNEAGGARTHAADGQENDLARTVIDWLSQADPEQGTIHRAATNAFEKPLFEELLRRTGGNQVRTAAMLGINRNTLRKRLSDLQIDVERFAARG